MEIRKFKILAQRKMDFIHKKILDYEWVEGELGLIQGKIGASLYYFIISRSVHEDFSCISQKEANRLLVEIFDELDTKEVANGFFQGLAGIAYGINYLIKEGFVEGDVDKVLESVDDVIFREIAHLSNFPLGLENGTLGYLTYLLPRIKKGNSNIDIEKDYFFKQLLIILVNGLGDAIEQQKLRTKEPILFDVTWELPISLMILASLRKSSFYNSKVNLILTYLSKEVLSLYPRLQSNRLYLLVGMEYVLKEIELEGWSQHSKMLIQGIDLEYIFYSELKDKNINIANGAAGIYWLIKIYNRVSNHKNPLCFDAQIYFPPSLGQ